MKLELTAREVLCHIYLDFVNNFNTLEDFASENQLTCEDAATLIQLARTIYYSDASEV